MQFDVGYAIQTVPTILSAAGTTIIVAILSCVGAATLGFVWEILRRSGKVMAYVSRWRSPKRI